MVKSNSTTSISVFTGLLLVSFLQFFRTSFFLTWDEWTVLSSLASNPFSVWLAQTHMGHFFPMSKLFYFAEIAVFKDHYTFFLATNCLMNALTGYCLYKLLVRLEIRQGICVVCSMIYVMSYAQFEAISVGMTVMNFISAIFLLLSLIHQYDYLKEKKQASFVYSCIFSACSCLSFGVGIVAPLINIIFAFCLYFRIPHHRVFYVSLVNLVLFVVFAATYMYFTNHSYHAGYHPGAISRPQGLLSLDTFTSLRFLFALSAGVLGVPVKYLLLPPDLDAFATLGISLAVTLAVAAVLYRRYKIPRLTYYIFLYFLVMAILCGLTAMSRTGPSGLLCCLGQRYQTLYLLPVLAALAFLANRIGASTGPKKVSRIMFAAYALFFLVFNTIHLARLDKSYHQIRQPRLARQKYFDFKSRVLQDPEDAVYSKAVFFDTMNPDLTHEELAAIIRRVL
ncbi:MAG: hypothetical protein A2583_07650 [Bdellovibrionales bacterium RIFOXYD1_FULL_53_11]|nr:MAG: hypothetical protein A2583_07650 [Bdellovibrionales bacterium RIFOXYD1_FULL_53_11]